ncbi:uncharacterized protein LOC127010387 [Eriocheir sinensis]|uniref:uncharacterized protein LOC127010387 n=1 Tax=Eriocheir sinensis TaxID=95602 RepID=UPI0021C6F39A|nr:uncharacterized protein LOC127010387 [Eriocheir sinensis]
MATETTIACCVRVPTSKQVTALHLAAEQATRCCCYKRRSSATFMTVELLPERCVAVDASTKEFGECRVAVNWTVVAELETECFVRIKVKRGRRTLRKKALDARLLIKCLQEGRLVCGDARLVFDIASYSPLRFCFQVKTTASECPAAGRRPATAARASVCTQQPSAGEEDFHDAQEPAEEEQTSAAPPPKTVVTQTSINKMPRRYRRRILEGGGGILRRLRDEHLVTVEYNERSGRLKLEGRPDDVCGCQDDLDALIQAWQQEQDQEHTKRKAAKSGAEGGVTEPRQEPGCRSFCSSRVCVCVCVCVFLCVCGCVIVSVCLYVCDRVVALKKALTRKGEPKDPRHATSRARHLAPQQPPSSPPSPPPPPPPPSVPPPPLLPLRRLSSADRRDILGQRWLSDDVMDLAQELLQRQFPNTRGLYASGAAFTLPPLQPGSGALFLQVVNRSTPQRLASMADYGRTGGSHWLLLSSYGAARGGQLAVYDSLHDTLSPSTAALVRQLQALHAPPPGAVLRPVQRQRDDHSCGLFALAFAFSIAHGQDPCRVRYVRARMERHLLACLDRGVATPFPSVPEGTFG